MNKSTNLFKIFLFLLIPILSQNCADNTQNTQESKDDFVSLSGLPTIEPSKPKIILPEFDRKENAITLQNKIKNGESITIHLRVPLCDNDNQGIVKVGKKLGDGLDLRSNLYWGAKYGVKNYFKKIDKWTLLESQKDISPDILERLIFSKEYPNNAKAYLIADAYRGDRMKSCVEDFMNSIAGKKEESITIKNKQLKISSAADLLVFNGHNGLMDVELNFIKSVDNKVRDVSVIGCMSHWFFVDHLKHSKGYPLLMTTNLMAPESYVMGSLFDAWVMGKAGSEIRSSAGLAYHQYQKCGVRGATKLFKTGW